MIGSIGFPEVIMIFVVVLLLFGPKKLPDFAKTFGKALREFRKTVNDAKATIEEEIDKADLNVTEDIKAIDQDLKQIARMDIEDENYSEPKSGTKPGSTSKPGTEH
jgi:sec-independent protein translocase protein TatA